jgi:sec-independent protein translocase protein TatC
MLPSLLARDVIPRVEGFDHDEHEAILEVRAFSEDELADLIGGGDCRFEYSCHLCQIEGAKIDRMNWRRLFDCRELKDDPKPFLDHMEDLRKMVIKMLVVLAVMMAVGFAFQKNVVEIIERPLLAFDPDRTSLTNFGVADPLTIAIELSFYAGLVMAFPFLVLFLAEFVLPALTVKERRMLYRWRHFLWSFHHDVLFATTARRRPSFFFNYSGTELKPPGAWSIFTTQFSPLIGLRTSANVLLLVKLRSELEVLQKCAFAVVIILLRRRDYADHGYADLDPDGGAIPARRRLRWIAWIMERKVRRFCRELDAGIGPRAATAAKMVRI